MSGVQVGTVSDMQLAPDGKSVTITLRIYRQYQIYKDARFVIEQSGFLGDQYVAILPTKNEGPKFGPGDEAKAEPPLDMQEMARSAAGFLAAHRLRRHEYQRRPERCPPHHSERPGAHEPLGDLR